MGHLVHKQTLPLLALPHLNGSSMPWPAMHLGTPLVRAQKQASLSEQQTSRSKPKMQDIHLDSNVEPLKKRWYIYEINYIITLTCTALISSLTVNTSCCFPLYWTGFHAGCYKNVYNNIKILVCLNLWKLYWFKIK